MHSAANYTLVLHAATLSLSCGNGTVDVNGAPGVEAMRRN
jgi:hypothetical protein